MVTVLHITKNISQIRILDKSRQTHTNHCDSIHNSLHCICYNRFISSKDSITNGMSECKMTARQRILSRKNQGKFKFCMEKISEWTENTDYWITTLIQFQDNHLCPWKVYHALSFHVSKVVSHAVWTYIRRKSYWDFCIGFVVQQNPQNVNASISAGDMNSSSVLYLEVNLYDNKKSHYIKCKSCDIYLISFMYLI